MSSFDWRKFLQEYSQELLADPVIQASLPDTVVASGWLGYDPATSEDVRYAQEGLGIVFPESYREFLLVTNGWRCTGPFIKEFCTCETVRWFSDENLEWIEAYNTTTPLGHPGDYDVPDDKYFSAEGLKSGRFRNRYLKTALQISEVHDGVLLLCSEGLPANAETEAWFFANWIPGAQRHATFKDLMIAQREGFQQLQ